MPILTRSESRRPDVQCVREVRVGIPRERLREVVYFYTRLVGLRPWPEAWQIPGGWGAGDPQRGVYFQFRHAALVDPMQRRFGLVVSSLDRLEKRLGTEEWPYERRHGLAWSDQYVVLNDPVGHRIEIRQLQSL
jgi:hypothetical protein